MKNPKSVAGFIKSCTIKEKIAFAMIMGIITTGIITFSLTSINGGFKYNFIKTWLQSWVTAYVIIIPCLLIIAPGIKMLVECLFRQANNNDLK